EVQNDKNFKFKGLNEYEFISKKKQEFDGLFESTHSKLPDEISNYIHNLRNQYKSALYLNSICK
ncbi:4692_t:CDS:1, partial [Cetraspora pellucida]